MVIHRKYTGFPDGCELNPMQELIVPYIEDSETNLVVKSPTGSGKSTVVTMMGVQHLEKGKSVLYVGVTKALVDEKVEDLSKEGHPWQGCKKFVLTGDFVIDDTTIANLKNANVIVATPESLVSRLRNHTSDKSQFLNNVGVVVWDEIHLVADETRGGNYEIAVAELASHYPHIQHVALSGTIPNAEEFSAWFSNLSPKPCKLIVSDYKPIPVETSFVLYSPESSKMKDVEKAKINEIVKLINTKPEEKWMICVFKKAFGKQIADTLRDRGYNFALHNADLDRSVRKDVEHALRNKAYDGVICTQTLMTGVNMPTPNLIVTALEVAQKPLPVYMIQQAMGRAGRKGLDAAGYCYLLVNADNYNFHANRLAKGERIVSTLHNPSTLATHFLGAVHMGTIRTKEDINSWFERTFLHSQHQIEEVPYFDMDHVQDMLLKHMRACAMITAADENGMIYLTNRGRIAVQQMVDPYHFADLLKNMKTYFSLSHPTDADFAMAFACCSGYRASYITKDQKAVAPAELRKCPDEYLAHAAAVFSRLKEKDPPYQFTTANFQVWADSMRMGEAVVRASRESERWYDIEVATLRSMFIRIQLKLDKDKALMKANKLTVSESKKLVAAGINTVEEMRNNADQVAQIITKKTRLSELGLTLGAEEV